MATPLCLIQGQKVARGCPPYPHHRRTAGQALTPPPGGRALSLQSSTQEIGEELVNGVIYSISLRKIQVHHGASKGQRWLGVSAGGPGVQGLPTGIWAPTLPPTAQSTVHCSLICVKHQKDTFMLFPFTLGWDCKIRKLEKARFGKRTRPAIYRNGSPLMRREGAAVRLVSCCTNPREEAYMWKATVLRGPVLLQGYWD